MNNPIVQSILYGLRRHWLALVFLLMSVGALVGAMQFSTGQEEAQKKAEGEFAAAQGTFVTDIPMDFKPVPENVEQADENLARIGEFFSTAKGVLTFDVNATYEGDFLRHLNIKINDLNKMATLNRVKLQNTTMGAGQTNRKYHFSFGHFQTNTILPADQIEGLALALHDVRNISGIFLESGILELKSIQRVRMVRNEDKGLTGSSQAYLDDLKHYTNEEESLEGYPYRVTFVCYPEGLAQVLWRIATYPAAGKGIYLTRNMKIQSLSAAKEAGKKGGNRGGDGAGGPGGFGGFGGDPGGGGGLPGGVGGGAMLGGIDNKSDGKDEAAILPEASIDALADSGLASKSAKTAIAERLLRVELHLDIIRSRIKHADGREPEEVEDDGF